MRYDLNLIRKLCDEIGLSACNIADQTVGIDLGWDAVLYFQNVEGDAECLVGFLGMPWHFHDVILFADASGNYLELDYLNLVMGLKEGTVLVCEQQVEGRVVDRWLIHSKYNDEFQYLDGDEKIIIRRAMTNSPLSAHS